MSIRGIVASPAGINSRVDKLEETLKADLRRLENKSDTHQKWSRPVLTGIAIGLLFVLLNAVAKPWLEGLMSDETGKRKVTVPVPQMSPDAGVAPPSPPTP